MAEFMENLSISSQKNEASLEKWKSISAAEDDCKNNQSGGFDCNICLEIVQDPVVTLCGHLYCWPCIYKWIHFQSSDKQRPQCPVCKKEVSDQSLVPLYGRGQTTTKPAEGKIQNLGINIPKRPPSPRCGAHSFPRSTTAPIPQGSYSGSYAAMPAVGARGASHPMSGMFGEMIYARFFGNTETTVYAYPNSYHLTARISPRQRRQLIQTDRSLGRVCFFLLCSVVVCLLLF